MGQNRRGEPLCHGMYNDVFCYSPEWLQAIKPQELIEETRGQKVCVVKSGTAVSFPVCLSVPSVLCEVNQRAPRPQRRTTPTVKNPFQKCAFPLVQNSFAVQKRERCASLQLVGLKFKPFTSATALFMTHLYLQYSAES